QADTDGQDSGRERGVRHAAEGEEACELRGGESAIACGQRPLVTPGRLEGPLDVAPAATGEVSGPGLLLVVPRREQGRHAGSEHSTAAGARDRQSWATAASRRMLANRGRAARRRVSCVRPYRVHHAAPFSEEG